ncbi:alpha-L-fucosidase [Pontiellaceae bacterium B1224]|nr:alpha-L-fucosidase [Pontiellaceae bacterium B1224]
MIKKTVLALALGWLGQMAAAGDAEASAAAGDRMEWWQDARFGMFIHWGVYSKAGGEWKGTTDHGEWLQFTAKIPLAEYTEFARGFNPVDFDAEEWVQIAKDAGMKYMVITTKHHDGFAMFDSPSNEYNIVDWTQFGRDPIKELADASHDAGIHFGVYYSLGRDWHDPDVPTGGEKGRSAGDRSNLIDYPDESIKDFSKYFERKVKPQVRELLTQYGAVDIMWFDTPEKISAEQSAELLEMIRELQPQCIVNNRIGNGLGDYGTPEQEIPEGRSVKPWETCMTVSSRIWGYNKTVGYRDSEELIRNLIDISSKSGNYLLNVGPTGEGIIPSESVERLQAMGDWLRVNGEAIYACGPTPFGGEAGHYSDTEKDKHGKPKFVSDWKWRATTKPGKLYIHIFQWSETIKLPAFGEKVIKAYLLADPDQVELTFTQSDTGIVVTLPEQAPDAVASVVCLEFK